MISITSDIWDKVFKNGPSKICGRQAHGLRGLEIKETKINNRARAIEQIFVFDCCTKNVQNPQESADLVTFTEEILNGKHHFLYSGSCQVKYPWNNSSINPFLANVSNLYPLKTRGFLTFSGSIETEHGVK